MINLGIIGTNWITHQFVQAALSTKQYELTAVYSRHLEKAQEFGAKYEGDIAYATDLETFLVWNILIRYTLLRLTACIFNKQNKAF